jgi:hypothetical protein
MKINDILDCYNAALEGEREDKGLPKTLGHFVFYTHKHREFGHIKAFDAVLSFFNVNTKTAYPVVEKQITVACKIEQEEEFKDKVTKLALKDFICLLSLFHKNGQYEQFVNGDFQGWN